MLAIEIDGGNHRYKATKDLRRQQQIECFGITMVRFKDIRVKKDMDGFYKIYCGIFSNWKIKRNRFTHPDSCRDRMTPLIYFNQSMRFILLNIITSIF